MELRASFQIPTLIKALTDVVLPAVDPHNKLAQEQAQLIIASLHLMAQRLPLQARYDRFELSDFVEFAQRLDALAADCSELASAVSALRACAAKGREVLDRAGADAGELDVARLALREAVGRLVQAASTLRDEQRRKAIESAVVSHAKALLLRERAWLAMQGWEGKDAALPSIESLIGG